MSYQTFDLSLEGHIAHLQLSRPEKYNSLNQAFWREFPEAISALDGAAKARALVISGKGKHFSAGMDLEVFSKPDPDMFNGEAGRRAEAMRRLVMQLQTCLSVLEEVRMPVMTAIQGGCIGGALDMVCASDMRYCTEDAYFVIKETELGMTADLGTLQRLPQLISSGLARELAFSARKLLAREAWSAGLVNQVFADQHEMLSGVMEIAQRIAIQSPLAVTGSKQMINYSRDHSMADSLNYMATWQAGMLQPTDMMQTFAAKMAGKPPEFEPLRAIKPPLSDN
jgi:enoyl-CoA hydratase